MIGEVDLDKVTLEDCEEMYKFKALFIVINNGHIECFKEV